MPKKLATPCSAPKRGLPCEMKYDYAMGGYSGILKAFLYAIREKYGANAALEIYARICKLDGRIKRFTNTLLKIFEIEGNDCETIGEWFDVYGELCGHEITILERSKTINRFKITKCAFKTEPIDISHWDIDNFVKNVVETINPKATIEQTSNMCAGDPYCEFVVRLEE